MTTIILSVPEELKKEIDEFSDINWSAVAREAIKRILTLKKFTKESTLTEKDALRLGRVVNKSLSKEINNHGPRS